VSSERHKRIKEIFLTALEKKGKDRESYLESACHPESRREVEALLEFDQRSLGFIDAPPIGPMTVPETIGNFRILQKIGEGGMGTVFEAQQDKPRRTVALKILSPGLATPRALRRFEFEGELLGRLQHPGIAQIFEAGCADTGYGPQPYFAMELIRGEPLTAYAGNLSIDKILKLMIRVCKAVHHAHQKGVVHRDLKPGNILVDETGQPKVLDFGVAHATDLDQPAGTLLTQAGQVIGTLQYMSPEQAAGDQADLDTRSDVYSLGVILYELLAGKPPYNVSSKTLPGAVKAVLEEQPARLGSLNRACRGDVETMVMKALEKDRERRYASAAELAADLGRHLDRRPIEALPPSGIYRLRKFIARHKGLSAGLFFTFIALAAGIVATSLERDAAREAAETAETINEFLLIDLLASPDPRRLGREVRVVEVLDRASDRIDQAFSGKPRIEAAVRDTLAQSYEALGLLDEAERYAVKALEMRRETLGDTHAQTLESMGHLVEILASMGRLEEGIDLARKTLELQEKYLGRRHPATLTCMANLGSCLAMAQRTPEALDLLFEVLKVRTEELGPHHLDTLFAMNTLFVTLDMASRYDEADALAEKTLQACLDSLGAEHPLTHVVKYNYALLLERRGRLEDAEKLYSELLDSYRNTFGEQHYLTTFPMASLASSKERRGDHDSAEALLRRVLELRTRTLGREHYETINAGTELALFLMKRGKMDEAVSLAESTVDVQRAELGADHPRLAASLNTLGRILRNAGRHEEAEEAYREAIGIYRRADEGNQAGLSGVLYNLGVLLYREMRDPGAAVPFFEEALAMDRRRFGDRHANVAGDLFNLGRALHARGDPAQAEPLFRELLESEESRLAEDDPLTLGRKRAFGLCLIDLGKFDEAERYLRAAYEGFEKEYGPDHDRTREAMSGLVRLYEAWDKHEIADSKTEKTPRSSRSRGGE
jgi:serine/threonine protein kinase